MTDSLLDSSWIHFDHPWVLLLFLGLPFLAMLLGKERPAPSVAFTGLSLLPAHLKKPKGGPKRLHRDVLRYVILSIFILALARPQRPYGNLPDHAKGIDIMLSLDFSKSMEVEDYIWEGKQVSRKKALVEVIKNFMEDRTQDRFGICGFAKFAYLASPLTLDQNWISQILDNIDTGTGTAIGDGIMLSVDYMLENPDREKTIILVSDGLNNRGTPPLEAARYAAQQNIRIYTIRIFPQILRTSAYSQNVMFRIAEETGGQFYQATDTHSLTSIYDQIDELEVKRVEQKRFQSYHELFPWFLALAAGLLVVELVCRQWLFRRLP